MVEIEATNKETGELKKITSNEVCQIRVVRIKDKRVYIIETDDKQSYQLLDKENLMKRFIEESSDLLRSDRGIYINKLRIMNLDFENQLLLLNNGTTAPVANALIKEFV